GYPCGRQFTQPNATSAQPFTVSRAPLPQFHDGVRGRQFRSVWDNLKWKGRCWVRSVHRVPSLAERRVVYTITIGAPPTDSKPRYPRYLYTRSLRRGAKSRFFMTGAAKTCQGTSPRRDPITAL